MRSWAPRAAGERVRHGAGRGCGGLGGGPGTGPLVERGPDGRASGAGEGGSDEGDAGAAEQHRDDEGRAGSRGLLVLADVEDRVRGDGRGLVVREDRADPRPAQAPYGGSGRGRRLGDEDGRGPEPGEGPVRVVEEAFEAGERLGVPFPYVGGRFGRGVRGRVEEQSVLAELVDEEPDGGTGAFGADLGDERVLVGAVLQERDAALGDGVQDLGAAQHEPGAGAAEVDPAGDGRVVQVGARPERFSGHRHRSSASVVGRASAVGWVSAVAWASVVGW